MGKKHLIVKKQHAFTLVEVLVVIAIVGILSTIGFVMYSDIRQKAIVAKMSSDFHDIKVAWQSWNSLTNKPYPDDDTFGPDPNPTECGTFADNPKLSKTILMDSTLPNFDKKYFTEPLLNPITYREYRYDNDTADTDGGENDGINVRLYFCTESETQNAKKIIPQLDRQIDNGDGESNGSFKWTYSLDGDPNQATIYYNMFSY